MCSRRTGWHAVSPTAAFPVRGPHRDISGVSGRFLSKWSLRSPPCATQHNMRHAACNPVQHKCGMQHSTTCAMRHATPYNMRHAACNPAQHKCGMQRSTTYMRHATQYNMRHAACNTVQHAPCGMQHSTTHMRHATQYHIGHAACNTVQHRPCGTQHSTTRVDYFSKWMGRKSARTSVEIHDHVDVLIVFEHLMVSHCEWHPAVFRQPVPAGQRARHEPPWAPLCTFVRTN
jgi:hypothetical protein